MRPESPLDVQYWLNPHVTSSIKSTDSVAVFYAGSSLELSIDLFQVLMSFAEKKTTRQAFQALDVDAEIDEFARTVNKLFDCGLLRCEQHDEESHNLRSLLNSRIFADPILVDKISNWIRLGRAIVIPDALPTEFAGRVHHDLDRATDWTIMEGGHDFFHYRNCGLEGIEGRTPALSECKRLFSSTATRRFMNELSGRNCSGEVSIAATWYRPGEYALPHNDLAANDSRSVAYIWYLAKDWRQEWGGSLFWCPTGQYVRPEFNALTIFSVMPSNVHLVCPVALGATSKRLSINGFWHCMERGSRSLQISPGSIVSPPSHGQPAPGGLEQAPFIVL